MNPLAIKTVLVVDDAPDNQLLLTVILNKKGILTKSALNGEEGFHQALAGKFDLIFMDMQMPVMDGYTATRKLREAGYTGAIVALTAHAMKEDRQKCLDAGCDEYLTKPLDTASFEKILATDFARPEAKTAVV